MVGRLDPETRHVDGEPSEFLSVSEELWMGWLKKELDVPPFISKTYDLDAVPEPYISFGEQASPLVILLTNPGGTMDHQKRAAVEAGRGPIRSRASYADAAKDLGAFYADPRNLGGQAHSRIQHMLKLAELVGHKGVLQVELCPFHKASLSTSQKGAWLEATRQRGLLGRYAQSLRAFLAKRPVVIVSAAATGDSLKKEMTLRPWVNWASGAAGLNLEAARFVCLVQKESKTTVAAIVSRARGVPKALVLAMGMNALPAEDGLRRLAAAFSGEAETEVAR